MSKILKNNFFVDGEKLLRHMSADSPGGKNDSIQTSKDKIVVQKDKYRKTSVSRPLSKARANNRYQNDDTGKVTLDDGTLHKHKKNKIQIAPEADENHSARKKTEDQSESPQKSRVSGLDKLVKNNIKKKCKLNSDELIKKFMEETQRRKKKDDINTRNLEVRKMNAKPVN